jgi:hypothetical protein
MECKIFMENKVVSQAYDRWINDPHLFAHNYFERQLFYHFVIACVRYVKSIPFITREEGWRRIDMVILKDCLCADLSKKKNAEWGSEVTKILIRFETLIEYEKTRYSQGLK